MSRFLLSVLATVGVVTAVLTFLLGHSPSDVGPVVAASDDRVRVFVNYEAEPDDADDSELEDLGATILYHYTIIPAVAALVPLEALDDVEGDPDVQSRLPLSQVANNPVGPFRSRP